MKDSFKTLITLILVVKIVSTGELGHIFGVVKSNWHEHRDWSWSPFSWTTGNNISGHYIRNFFLYWHSRLHLGLSAQLKIWQVSACKIEPRSGNISWKNRPPRPYGFFLWNILHSESGFVLVCPHLLCLSPPFMSVPTFYVCPHLSCLSPPIMYVPTFYVCSHLLPHSAPYWIFS